MIGFVEISAIAMAGAMIALVFVYLVGTIMESRKVERLEQQAISRGYATRVYTESQYGIFVWVDKIEE